MRSRRGVRWHWKGSSYLPSGTEVYGSEAGEAVGLVFGFGVRGPAEGGGAVPILLPAPPRPARRSAKLVHIFLEG